MVHACCAHLFRAHVLSPPLPRPHEAQFTLKWRGRRMVIKSGLPNPVSLTPPQMSQVSSPPPHDRNKRTMTTCAKPSRRHRHHKRHRTPLPSSHASTHSHSRTPTPQLAVKSLCRTMPNETASRLPHGSPCCLGEQRDSTPCDDCSNQRRTDRNPQVAAEHGVHIQGHHGVS